MSSSPTHQPLPGPTPDPDPDPASDPALPAAPAPAREAGPHAGDESVVPPSPAEAAVAAAAASETGDSGVAALSVPLWNIANILTMSRVALVPVFAFLLVHGGGHSTAWRLAAAAVFFVASITDRFDGELARKRGLITDFGKIADPIADKALMGTALVTLSVQDRLWWWVTVVIVVRELGITLLRFWVINYGVISASRGGKLKTLLQALAIFLYVLPLDPAHPDLWFKALNGISIAIMAAALVVTVVTGFDYIAKAIRLRRAGASARTPADG